MKHSGTDWIGEIPVQWELAPTKRVFRGKKRIVGDEADNYERLALTLNGVVKRNKDDNEGLQPEQFNGYQILEKNELVFKLIDLQNIRTSRVGLSPYTGIVSPAYIILSNSETDNRFYYYWFMDMYNRCIFNQMGDDGVRSALNIKDVLEIPLPLIAESTRIKIASFLDKKCAEVDEMIALQEQIIEELKAYKQSVITEAVTKGLNPDVPMKDSGIEWIGQIPEHWDVKRLKFVAERHNQKVSDEVLPYIGLENVESFSERFIETENEYDITQAQVCAVGDVIFGKLRPYLGKAMVIKTEHCCSSEFLVLSGSGAPSYLRYLLLSDWFVEIVNASTYGTKMPRANADYIMNMQVVCPPIDERKAIADYLGEKCADIDSLIQTKQSKIDSLKEYKKSIIYEYVTGKKEVK